jgi:hypothetical protein
MQLRGERLRLARVGAARQLGEAIASPRLISSMTRRAVSAFSGNSTAALADFVACKLAHDRSSLVAHIPGPS